MVRLDQKGHQDSDQHQHRQASYQESRTITVRTTTVTRTVVESITLYPVTGTTTETLTRTRTTRAVTVVSTRTITPRPVTVTANAVTNTICPPNPPYQARLIRPQFTAARGRLQPRTRGPQHRYTSPAGNSGFEIHDDSGP
jgi:hypothetical protein